MTDRKFFLALTVKNEAPNLWEWVAYHRAIGFTDIAIYQNDSTDGTKKLLRTMEKHGFIQYFTNPSRDRGWQNKAYRRASRLDEYKAAEWAMSLDCDEFLVIKTGNGTVSDLVDALPQDANVCTIHWKAFGSSYHTKIPKGLVTEEFTLTEEPKRISERQMGFKSIFKPTAFKRIGIHKPKDAFAEVPSIICNGSGILLQNNVDPGWRSKDPDCRRLAQVNHYALRDVERFLVKSGRGRTANHERSVDIQYWTDFDINEATDMSAADRAEQTRAEMKLMNDKTRGRLELLTQEGVDANHVVFNELLDDPYYKKIYDDIVELFPAMHAPTIKTDEAAPHPGIDYSEVIVTNGVKVPFVPKIITPPIEKPMRNNRYEGGECAALRELLIPGDRVLELGAGVGLLSTVAAMSKGVESVLTVEANPEMIPLIKETHRLNGAKNIELINGVVAPRTTEPLDFYLRKDFWASSMEPDSRPYVDVVQVPSFGIKDLIQKQNPTVIAIDIEGGELGLFDKADLSKVRLLIIEFHSKVYGKANVTAITKLLEKKGLKVDPVEKPTTVRRFFRETAPAQPAVWPISKPRFLVTTCMKDEGPYILEWLAWHKYIGIQDFVVFTNDCSDGTDLILDRLEELGQLRHLPNPALATGSTFFQPIALKYTPHLSEWHKADFYISMDVDEFINVRIGNGQLSGLLQATGSFDALSMSELNHGSNGRMHFEPGLMTEQFPLHQTETPYRRKALRGVKTITRISEKLDRPRNHRPDFVGSGHDVVWLDGSGRPLETLKEDKTLNGIDVRGSSDFVVLDHFPLRSLESYLIKMFRGDVVVKKNQVSQRYWRLRNQNDSQTSNFDRQQKGFQKQLKKYMADPMLKSLHGKSCEIHAKRAVKLLTKPDFIERKEWILANAWNDGLTSTPVGQK